MVKSETVFSTRGYLKLVTGKDYVVRGRNDIKTIESILAKEARCLWNYPLSEIDHIVKSNLDVVLVRCMVWNEDKKGFDWVFRWFEVEGD